MRRIIPVLFVVAAACQSEKASVEDLYATRMLGLGYLQRNQLAQAESAFTKLSELAPDDPFGYANLGLTYLQTGRFAEAEKQLKRAHELDPSSADVSLLLAKVYTLTDRDKDARAILEKLRSDTTNNARVLFALAQLEARQPSSPAYENRLRDVLAVAPANIAVRLDLVEALARRNENDSVVKQLEEVRRIPPELPVEARSSLDSTIQLIRAGNIPASRDALKRLIELMKVTQQYQASLEDVKSPDGPIAGQPVLTFVPKDFISRQKTRQQAADMVRFVDATADVGVAPAPTPGALAIGDVDGDGTDDLFLGASLYRVQRGIARDVTAQSGISLSQGATYATFADYDNDGWLDLFAIGDGRGRLFRNRGDATFSETTKAGITNLSAARKALFADLDHDGDLDLLLVSNGASTVYRNNLDGTFTDVTSSFGLARIAGGRDAGFADFDDDGRVDLFIAGNQNALLRNGGSQRFADVTEASGLTGSSDAVAAGDINNDGFIDLYLAGASDGELWLNKGNGTFNRDSRSPSGLSAAFVDYDNDGWLDLVLGGKSSVSLLRNDGAGKFSDKSSLIPAAIRNAGATTISVSDMDSDGDQDFYLLDSSGSPRVLRNDFGNNHFAVNVELKALRTGSGKNNAFGVGSKVQLRAGEIFQTRIATGRTTHFGLGSHLKADVLRVEWPNGVPQTVYFPGSDQDVVESEILKGSCAFIYTWDGKGFRFVTDAMWRSALGMPLGLMGSTSAFAPAGASQEYVRIRGDALQPRNGRYVLQFTEELWETAYADEVKLLAVDHPDSVDVFVDERFIPPGPVSLRLFNVTQRYAPLSAIDERGNNVLSELRESDDVYVSNFTPTRYQGVVEPHEIVLDLGKNAGDKGTFLFLRGWIYPTDASINVALSQQASLNVFPPALETRDVNGKWRRVADIGFPSGKDKTIIIDLAGKFPTKDRHVRVRTSMQIYWDEAFVARDLASASAKVTTLRPLSADLHFRGFSRMYRKGGRYGPFWFAYDDATKESPWRPITGSFTRFGDVLPLLQNSDDMYIVMAAGDEATIEFDASSAKSLPAGWKRDFLLYTDGWVKDSDLNTAFGTAVDPLPFHKVRSYPYSTSDSYPSDAPHQRYLREYNTRVVGPRLSAR